VKSIELAEKARDRKLAVIEKGFEVFSLEVHEGFDKLIKGEEQNEKAIKRFYNLFLRSQDLYRFR
jgi:uncharacterized protein YfbU (UPF0304 family)